MSDFLDAVVEMLAEYGEPATIKNRSGTVTGTSVQTYSDQSTSFYDYYPENAANADDPGLRTIYMAGTVTLEPGYHICLPAGTFTVVADNTPKDGTITVLHAARCRKE